MSLHGCRVVVTRAPHQAEKLEKRLRERGVEPVLFPCIDIEPPEDASRLDAALKQIGTYDWLLLTSTNTVIALEKRLAVLGIPKAALQGLAVGVVGPKTAKAVSRRLGLTVNVVPEEAVAEGLLAALPEMVGRRVLLPQSAIARDVLAEELTAAGADITAVAAYCTVTGRGGADIEMVEAADALTFTSSSTVTGFVERAGGVMPLPAVCIGPVTAATAIDCGFERVFAPEDDYSLAGMLAVLEQILDE